MSEETIIMANIARRMTYRELYESLVKKYADEKGVIRGKPVILLYRISKAAETYGLDSLVPNGFDTSID